MLLLLGQHILYAQFKISYLKLLTSPCPTQSNNLPHEREEHPTTELR